MKALPGHLKRYKTSPVFDQVSVPRALLDVHRLKEGTWGRIVVESGELEYEIIEGSRKWILAPNRFGVVEPQVPHRVRPVGAVRFWVEFFGVPGPE